MCLISASSLLQRNRNESPMKEVCPCEFSSDSVENLALAEVCGSQMPSRHIGRITRTKRMPSEMCTSQGPFISMLLFYVSWGPEMCSSPIPTAEISITGINEVGFLLVFVLFCFSVFFFFLSFQCNSKTTFLSQSSLTSQ